MGDNKDMFKYIRPNVFYAIKYVPVIKRFFADLLKKEEAEQRKKKR